MKKSKLIIATVIIAAGFTACTSSENNTVTHDVETFSHYVDSVETAPRVYTEANWTEIENGYQARLEKIDQSADKLSSEVKANAEVSKAKYEAMKKDYELRLREASAATGGDYRLVLRNNLFGDGKIGTDMSFAYVNADNILEVYQRFVNTVEENKDKYTREDWDEIKVLYEALDSRKNTVEKEGLKTADNLKIAGLKVKFAAIKATHRVVSKIEENIESKQK